MEEATWGLKGGSENTIRGCVQFRGQEKGGVDAGTGPSKMKSGLFNTVTISGGNIFLEHTSKEKGECR